MHIAIGDMREKREKRKQRKRKQRKRKQKKKSEKREKREKKKKQRKRKQKEEETKEEETKEEKAHHSIESSPHIGCCDASSVVRGDFQTVRLVDSKGQRNVRILNTN